MRPTSPVIFLIIVCLTGCQQPTAQPEPIQYSVPADVEPFVQSFRDEARKRNISVSTDNLIITFGTALGEDICGECLLESGKTPRITLNNDDFCWQRASQPERECLVFHELAHCLLKRGHKTDKFPIGAFASIMNPNNVAIYATCQYPIGGDECDKRPRRVYYIDELFDANTPAPTWAN
ncbi:hypothetical protein [Spirosoma pulveris]